MEPTLSTAGVAAQSLLTLLADGGGRTAALSLLHQRALQTTGGSRSLLFEHNPVSGDLQATSGTGLDELPTDAWILAGAEATFISQAFAGRVTLAVSEVVEHLPSLHARLRTDSAILVPLVSDTRRVGLLAIGLPSGAHLGTAVLERSDVLPGFLLALELSRLRQREEFERGIRDLLDEFTERLASTLDLSKALEPLCVSATRLFAADRTTVWVHDRESRSLVPLASSHATNLSQAVAVRTDDPFSPAAAALRTQRAGLASTRTEVTSVLTVPLRGCRRALGTVVFDGVRVEPGDDISVLSRADELGRQLSSAIETVQLLGVVSQARRELELLFTSIALPIVVIDSNRQIVRANQAFADAVGQAVQTLRQQPLGSCVGPELVTWLNDPQRPRGAPVIQEITDSVLGGPYVVTVSDLVTEDGSHSGHVIVARDVLPVVALREREELRSRLLQSEKLAALGHFVAGIAHELNNPLQGVLGHLELLRSTGAFSEKIRSEIRVVYRDANRAAKIVRDLLVFAGSGRLQRRKADLNGIAQKVVTLRRPSCRTRQIEVVRRFDSQLPKIQVDPLLLQQVFLNVVINAEQAVVASGKPGRIEITTGPGQESGWVIASVRDTGPGLSGDTLSRVFEPFYTTRDVGQGVGLGLALAYRIVQEHGGRIAAGNHPDGGAVFTVELPVA